LFLHRSITPHALFCSLSNTSFLPPSPIPTLL
jgi:hypothetical protein